MPIGLYPEMRWQPRQTRKQVFGGILEQIVSANRLGGDLSAVEVEGRRHLVLPHTFVYNDVRFLPGAGYSDPASFFDYCGRALDYYWREGASYPQMMSIGLHPRWSGQAGRTSALRDFLEYALEKGEVWFARRIDIASWWLDRHDESRP